MKLLGTKMKVTILTAYFNLWLLLISAYFQLDSFYKNT